MKHYLLAFLLFFVTLLFVWNIGLTHSGPRNTATCSASINGTSSSLGVILFMARASADVAAPSRIDGGVTRSWYYVVANVPHLEEDRKEVAPGEPGIEGSFTANAYRYNTWTDVPGFGSQEPEYESRSLAGIVTSFNDEYISHNHKSKVKYPPGGSQTDGPAH